jgi:hypothetical protein
VLGLIDTFVRNALLQLGQRAWRTGGLVALAILLTAAAFATTAPA